MTRLERLRHELVALADSHVVMVPCETMVGTGSDAQTCALCGGCGTRIEPHPLAAPLRGIAWSLLPREERYREPEHGGGPLGITACTRCNATGMQTAVGTDENVACSWCCGRGGFGSELVMAAIELTRLSPRFEFDAPDIADRLLQIAAALPSTVVKAGSGETLDDVLRREGLELAEETCTACDGQGWRVAADHPEEHGRVVRCGECKEGRVVAEDAIEVRVAGQVRYARRNERNGDDRGM